MNDITTQTREKLAPFGIEVRDVRIVRTDLPGGPLQNVYQRMRAERERLAREYRAKGDEQARNIRAEADKEARILVARARSAPRRSAARGTPRSPVRRRLRTRSRVLRLPAQPRGLSQDTEHAYENPKFVEDLVRDVALRLNAEPRVGRYSVDVENFESIHNHSAYARIERN